MRAGAQRAAGDLARRAPPVRPRRRSSSASSTQPRRAVGRPDEGAQRSSRRVVERRVRADRRVAVGVERADDARARRAGSACVRRGRRASRAAASIASSPARACDRERALPGAGTSSRRACPSPRRRGRAARARRRRARARRPRRRAARRSRVSTLPRRSHDVEVGRAARAAARARRSARCRRGRPRRSASSDGAPKSTSTRVARRGTAAIAVPSASSPGTSLAECTARSISPRSSARSSAPTQRDLSPRRAVAVAGGGDLDELEPAGRARLDTARAWASASALPRVPSLTTRSGGAARGPRARPRHVLRVGRAAAAASSAPRRARTARAAAPGARGAALLERLHADRRLVQQPLHRPRARSPRRARGRAARRLPAAGVLGQHLLDDRRRRARAAR